MDNRIAIIGMSGRFPDAPNLDIFWKNLRSGKTSIRSFEGEPAPSMPEDYVGRGAWLEDTDKFDPKAFGLTLRDAQIMDPQHRIFMECALEALYNAGYGDSDRPLTGMFAGSAISTYLTGTLLPSVDMKRASNFLRYLVANDKDYLATRLSYIFDLKGPSITVQTACSTSLCAVAMACESLLSYQCDMAIAGGVSVRFPDKEGYIYEEGGILSKTGTCRPFSTNADGTVFGHGAGVVILRRLEDALADGNYVHAVIAGAAINNDGSNKIGYTAPSADGQRRVVKTALNLAGVEPEDIQYIEAHGTGTSIGDNIELEALSSVWSGAGPQSCAIGSVKANIGHLDSASGIAGLIKTVLSLRHKEIPPAMYAEEAVASLQQGQSCFYMPSTVAEWKATDVRRAGISSFGVGGTNVHIVLEEAPQGSINQAKEFLSQFPAYPFQKIRCWDNGINKAVAETDGFSIAAPIHLPSGEVVFQIDLSMQVKAFLQDHKIGSESLMPAMGYVWFMRDIGRELLQADTCHIKDFIVMDRYVIHDKEPLVLQALAQLMEEGWKIKIHSRNGRGEWTLHAEAILMALKNDALEKRENLSGKSVAADDVYNDFDRHGLHYGPAFRRITTFEYNDHNAFAHLKALPEQKESLISEMDACLQTIAAHVHYHDGVDKIYLPYAINSIKFKSSRIAQKVFADIDSIKNANDSLSANAELLDIENRVVVSIEGIIAKRFIAQPENCFKPLLHEITWSLASFPQSEIPSMQEWVIVGGRTETGRTIAQALNALGNKASYIDTSSFLKSSWESEPSVLCLETDALQVLEIIKNCIQFSENPDRSIWISTENALAVTGMDIIGNVKQSILHGLAKSGAVEYSNIRLVAIDIGPDILHEMDGLVRELVHNKTDRAISLRYGKRYVPAVIPYEGHADIQDHAASFQLKTSQTGSLDNLYYAPVPRKDPEGDEVEISVEFVGISFRDTLNALGTMQDVADRFHVQEADEYPFGGECTGYITKVGPDCRGLSVGDRVVAAMALGCIGTFVCVPEKFVCKLPESVSLSDAATLPTAFITALHALSELGPLDRILIHAAAGGVGQAAVQVAKLKGAEIYATASPEKWDFLKQEGITHISNSRNPYFADTIKSQSGGRGVTYILNCLSGEMIDASMSLLEQGGTFVELGHMGVWGANKTAKIRPDVRYLKFDLLDIARDNPDLINNYLQEAVHKTGEGSFTPILYRTFDFTKVQDAFRILARGHHIGKILISFVRTSEIQEQMILMTGTCLVTGGLGGLGRFFIEGLADRGTTSIAVLGRSVLDKEGQKFIADMRIRGVSINYIRGDVSIESDVKDAINRIEKEMLPLTGIIHAAGVIKDVPLIQMTNSDWDSIILPKVMGAIHLDKITQKKRLNFFVCCSSLAATYGSAGQANYCAANAFLDSFARFRRSRGRTCLTAAFGPVRNTGMSQKLTADHIARFQAKGLKMLEPKQATSSLFRAMREGLEHVLIADLQVQPVAGAISEEKTIERVDYFSLPIHLRRAAMNTAIQEDIYLTLGADGVRKVEIDDNLFDAGVDSLMAIELRNRIVARFGCSFSVTAFFDYPTVDELTTFIASLAKIELKEGSQPTDSLSKISDDDLVSFLSQKLESDHHD